MTRKQAKACAHMIAAAAVHGAIMEGHPNRFERDAIKVSEALSELMDYHDRYAVSMDLEEKLIKEARDAQ